MSEIKLSFCVGGKHKSQNLNSTVIEKINPRTKKRIKIIKSKCSICGRNKSVKFSLCK